MADGNPYPAKVYHKAAKIAANGNVSALCSDPPRKINLKRALWTLRWEAVTCKKCLALKPKAE